MAGHRISVVFSFRNEEDALPELIARTRAALQGAQAKGVVSGYEMIFVNDASSDRSLEILTEESTRHGDIVVLTMSRPFGVSPCALAGMAHARGDAVVYLDADLQDPPEVIPQLIAAWRGGEGADVVHTVRVSREGESRFKIFVTHLGYRLLNAVMDFPLPFEAGDFKLLSRRVVDELVQCREHNPFLRGLVCWVGFRPAFVQYQRAPRQKGKSKFPILSRGVIFNFLDSALISFSGRLLKWPLFAGAALTVGATLLAVIFSLRGWVVPVLSPGELGLLVLVAFLGGLQLIALGGLGLYVNAAYFASRGRPNYIIRETTGRGLAS